MERESTQAEAPSADLPVLPNGWEYRPLSTLVDERRGISYGIVQPGPAVSDGVPIVRVNNIRAGRIAVDDVLRVAKDVEATYTRTKLRGGELLLTLVGTLGECAVAPSELVGWNVARAVAVIPVRPEVGAKWVEICLRWHPLQHFIQTRATTTVQATFNLRDVAKIPVPMPPDQTRQTITDILSTLADKIELNRRTNETLEAMARTLFRSWFVDFDPVQSRAAGRPPDGMDAEMASMFPDSLEDSPLGPIPKGWESVQFGDLVTLLSGGTPSKSVPGYWGGSIPWLSAKDMKTARIVDTEDHVTEEGADNGTKLVPAGTVLLLVRGMTLHKDLPICVATRPLTFNQDVKGISVKEAEYREFVYLWLLDNKDALLGVVDAASHGTGRIHTHMLTQRPVVKPPQGVVAAFNWIVQPLLQRATVNDEESVTLAATREALLPKLLSGEVWVSDSLSLLSEVR